MREGKTFWGSVRRFSVEIFDNPYMAEEHARKKEADVWEIERFMDIETGWYKWMLKMYYFRRNHVSDC